MLFKKSPALLLAGLLACSGFRSAQAQYVFTTLDDPLATSGTVAFGLSGGNVTGFYNVGTVSHGFIYNGSTYTTLDDPNASLAAYGGTVLYGISGSTIVGHYYSGSYNVPVDFIYSGGTYTSTVYPNGWSQTAIYGISGNEYVGNAVISGSGNRNEAYLYNGSAYLTLNPSNAAAGTPHPYSQALGISSTGDVVGWYLDITSSLPVGFLYRGGTYTAINDPLGTKGTYAFGISGNNIVGQYIDSNEVVHGFLYDGSTYTPIDDPLQGQNANQGTYLTSISGNEIVGGYTDSSGINHGFMALAAPEPSIWAELIFGFILVAVLRVRPLATRRSR